MIISQIRIDVSFKDEPDDAGVEEVLEAIESVDWADVARLAVGGMLAAVPSTVSVERLTFREIEGF